MMQASSTAGDPGGCRWCGMIHSPLCPAVKAIEYHPDGTVKRVEFKVPTDYMLPIYVSPITPMYPKPWEGPWVQVPQPFATTWRVGNTGMEVN